MASFCTLRITAFFFLVLTSGSVAGSFEASGVALASNGDEGDWYGSSVAIDGDTIVSGAPFEGIIGTFAGSVWHGEGAAYAYVRSGDGWVEQALLKSANGDNGDRFGAGVAISGDTIIVSAYGESSEATGVNGDGTDNSMPGAGAVYVFEREGEAWNQTAYLKSANPGVGANFGIGIAFSGDEIAIAAPREEGNGAVYVFARDGDSWRQEACLKPSEETSRNFGSGLAMDGDTIVVGSTDGIHVFDRVDGSWSEGQTVVAPGYSAFALAGDLFVVGAPDADEGGEDTGAAYIFERKEVGWIETAYLVSSLTDYEEFFGQAVAVEGEMVLIGAPRQRISVAGARDLETGAVFVFGRSECGWAEHTHVVPPDSQDGEEFGSAIAISGGTMVVGSPFRNQVREGEIQYAAGRVATFSFADSGLQAISSITKEGGALQIEIPSVLGRQIGVEYSPDFSEGSWDDVGSFVSSGGLAVFSDLEASRLQGPSGFYRAFLRTDFEECPNPPEEEETSPN